MLVVLASATIIIFLLYPYYSIPDISKSIDKVTNAILGLQKEVKELRDELKKIKEGSDNG